MNLKPWDDIIWASWLKYIGLFILSFCIRIALILDSPQMDKWIDLAIYADGGQLIVNGVNPYNFLDQMELRDSLRRDTIAYNYYVDETQARWNFYSSGNLPLTLYYFGLIEKLANGNLLWYRIIFALCDSVTAVILAAFIFQFWPVKRKDLFFILVVGLGAVSPLALYQGTLLSEDKTVQIALMLMAIYSSRKQNLLFGAWFLGWSIAFKGLGIFIFPLCVYLFTGEPNSIKNAFSPHNIKRAALFIIATTLFAIQPFIMSWPDVLDMMFNRLDQNLNALAPSHSSVWRFVYLAFPRSWENVKMTVVFLFFSINIIGLVRGRFGLTIITASVLLWFIDISLIAGSLDRMNIGFLTVILLLGTTQLNGALLLSAFYVFAGSVIFFSGYAYSHKLDSLDPELLDSAFSLVFVSLYTIILAYYALKGIFHQPVNIPQASSDDNP